MNNQLMSSSSLVGDDVKNHQGEDLGDIKDFMIDCESGKVAYAVLSFGGILGMGEKLFAVPMSALTLDKADHCLTMNVEKEKLKDAPGFDTSEWPNMADRKWGEDVHNFYGSRPYWQ